MDHRTRRTRRTLPLSLVALSVAIGLSGCVDLLFQPDRVLTMLAFEDSVVTVTEGDPIPLRPFLID